MVILFTSILNAEIALDKKLHAGVGTLLYFGCTATFAVFEHNGYSLNYDKSMICLIPVISVGAGKEAWDSTKENHTSDWQDAAYTILPSVGLSFVIYKW